MIKLHNIVKFAAAAMLLHMSAFALAQDSLDSLLDEVGAGQIKDKQVHEQRVSSFNAASAADQEALLADAEAKRTALSEQSAALSEAFSANELTINGLSKSLQEKAATLGLSEVFGLSRQVAGDLAMTLQQSLISTQFTPQPGQPSRTDELRAFAESKQVPTAVDIEKLWFEIQREMIASGQVAKYPATVIQADGNPVASTVVRVGPFTAVSGGQYLAYMPELQSLNVYPRQPPSDILDHAAELEAASEGYVQTVVDSARGVLMSLYVERPTWVQRIENGEHINYVILLVAAVASIAFIIQLIYLLKVRVKVAAQLKNLDAPKNDNPLGRILLAFKGDTSNIEQDADVAELRISESVSREVPKLERAQSMLRLAVAAGPLLGLIGTVLGMIITFQSITESGSSDPKLMAEGIGAAMIATVLGLGIAIPLLFGNALLTSLSRGLVQIIEEQSAGMLAESIERNGRV